MDILSHEVVVNIASAEPDDKLTLWHNRFGHAYIGALIHGVRKGKVRGITLKDNELAAKRLPIGLCDICARAKSHRGSFNVPASPKADVVGGWISADIQGPFATEDMDGNRYVLTLTDWYSRWSWSFLLRNKGDAENHIKKVVDVLVPQMGYAVKHYHTDGAHELLSKSLEEWMNSGDRRISTTVAPPSTPQLNANSERKFRTLYEMTIAMLQQSQLPPMYWSFAYLTATYLRNRVCTHTGRGYMTPFEVVYGKVPNVSHLRTWGCKATVYEDKSRRLKDFGSKGMTGIFVGYRDNTYVIYLPRTTFLRTSLFRHCLIKTWMDS